MERSTERSIIGRVATLTGIVAVAAFTASMLSGLRHAFGRKRQAPETERERVRRALAPMLVELDPKIWGDWLQPLPEDFDRVAFRRSLKIDPPLSQAISEERDEGY